jgi:hypothetical protein
LTGVDESTQGIWRRIFYAQGTISGSVLFIILVVCLG